MGECHKMGIFAKTVNKNNKRKLYWWWLVETLHWKSVNKRL